MPYSAEISRANPSCFVFVIDQSGSMADALVGGESPRKKADGVADAINRLLQTLVIKCAKSEGVNDYYHVSVIGYGATVGPAFQGALAGRELVPISEIASLPARIEERVKKTDDGAGGLVDQTVKFPIWFDSVANNGTPMRTAMEMAHGVLASWTAQHPASFPPVLVHITDGESTDGDPSEVMQRIMSLGSEDGSPLVFNLHVSSNAAAAPVTFPDSDANLPDQYARMLFQNSSPLTAFMRSVAREYNHELGEGARGFVLNGDLVMIIQALDIGTRPSNLR
jgi:hypothetical protein